jgi:hypothetical protein
MRGLVITMALTLAMMARADTTAPQSTAGTLVASLERTACYGTCPIYKIWIFSDGTVKYEGKRFVKKTGAAVGKLAPKALAQLAKVFARADFFALDEKYERSDITDGPSAIVFYDDGTRRKTISHYHGDTSAPESLRKLEDEIDRVVKIDRFAGTEKERAELPRR